MCASLDLLNLSFIPGGYDLYENDTVAYTDNQDTYATVSMMLPKNCRGLMPVDFTHILQDCCTGTRAKLPWCRWYSPEEYG